MMKIEDHPVLLSLFLGLLLFAFLVPKYVQASAPPPRLRIETAQPGLHIITYQDLARVGFPLDGLNPNHLAMTHRGSPIAIHLMGGEDGQWNPGDRILFWAQPYQGRYMATNIYWLILDPHLAQRVEDRALSPSQPAVPITTITHTLHLETNLDYRSQYPLPADADHWFDLPLVVTPDTPTITRTYTFTLDAITQPAPFQITLRVHGGRDQTFTPDQSLALRLNDRPLGLFQWDGSQPFQTRIITTTSILHPGPNTVELVASLEQFPPDLPIQTYWLSPDWIEIAYPGPARARENRITAPIPSTGPIELTIPGFTASPILAFDVQDPTHPVRITSTTLQPQGNTTTLLLRDHPSTPPRYALSSLSALLRPQRIQKTPPPHLRSPRGGIDYIAIVHPSLWDAIDPLLQHRQQEGLTVAKINVQDIYDEFNDGFLDPEAIRDFLAYAYHHWRDDHHHPQFVLLVGDGHYDFRGYSHTSLPNLIPPYLIHIDPWLGETAADNRYVCFDGPDDNRPELSIGRIPARTPAELTAVIDKILAYETAPAGAWQRRLIFVADRSSGFDDDFQGISDRIRHLHVPPGYHTQTIYYQNPYPDAAAMRTAIKDAFNRSALLIQWFGHASRFRWGSVSMFNILDPPTLHPNSTLPITFTYACWSGYFINLYHDWQSLGETLVLTPQRGSVADISPSGLHVGGPLAILNQSIIQAILNTETPRLGPALRAAKLDFAARSPTSHDILDTTILFGDPALLIRRPTHWPLYLPQILDTPSIQRDNEP